MDAFVMPPPDTSMLASAPGSQPPPPPTFQANANFTPELQAELQRYAASVERAERLGQQAPPAAASISQVLAAALGVQSQVHALSPLSTFGSLSPSSSFTPSTSSSFHQLSPLDSPLPTPPPTLPSILSAQIGPTAASSSSTALPAPPTPQHPLPPWPSTPFPAKEHPPAHSGRLFTIPLANVKLTSESIFKEFQQAERHIHDLEHLNNCLERRVDWLHRELVSAKGLLDAAHTDLEVKKGAMLQEMEDRWKQMKAEWVAEKERSRRYDDFEDSGDEMSDGSVDGEDDDGFVSKKRKARQDRVHPAIQKLITETYCLFLGTSKLTRSHLPVVSRAELTKLAANGWAELPFINSSKTIRQIRFDWEQSAADKFNSKLINDVVNHATEFGSKYVAHLEDGLATLKTTGELRKRFVHRFTYMKRVVAGTAGGKKKRKKVSIGDEEEGGGDGDEEEVDEDEDACRNRAPAKLAKRKRQYDTLPLDHPLRAPKYKALLYNQQMSDDEDFKELVDGKWERVKGKYCSRAPTWRSKQVQTFFDTIDALKDPNPSSQYWKRVRGDPKDVPLRKTVGFAGRTHEWMVDTEWWATHKQDNDSPHVIIMEDDEEAAARVKEVRDENREKRAAKAKKGKKVSKKVGKAAEKGKAKGKGKAVEEDDEEEDEGEDFD